jgi:hypothetical protein
MSGARGSSRPTWGCTDARGADRLRIWHVRSLKELFHVFVDDHGVLRCDHEMRFLGLPVLRLHYKMIRRQQSAGAAVG